MNIVRVVRMLLFSYWDKCLFHLEILVITLNLLGSIPNLLSILLSLTFALALSSALYVKTQKLKFMLASVAFLCFVIEIYVANIDFTQLTTFAFYMPMIYAYLLKDKFSTITMGFSIALIFYSYTGREEYIPPNVIIGVMFSMLTASISYTIIAYLIKTLKKECQKLYNANKQLKLLLTIDGLTRVFNRYYFDVHFELEWKSACRNKRSLSVIMIDIDYFKNYNDEYGHQGGDECLKKVAASLANSVQHPSGWVARYGGEEFAVVLPRCDINKAIVIAEQLRETVVSQKIPHGASPIEKYVTVSMGISSRIPAANGNPSTLVGLADKALYLAKAAGRNRYSVYE